MTVAVARRFDRPLLGIGLGGLAVAVVVAPQLAIGELGGAIGLAALAYAGSHALRLLRTLVVLGGSVRSVRLVTLAHLSSAPWGLLPLKLGELVRMAAIGRASAGMGHGLRVVWIERTFDAVLLAAAAVSALVVLPDSAPLVLPVLVLSASLLVLTVLAVVALPENLSTAKLWVMRRYTSDWSIQVLRVLDEIGEALRGLRGLVVGRVATLAVLTVAIWTAEIVGLWLLVPRLGDASEHLVVGMLAVLSDVLRPEATLGDGFGAATAIWRTIVFAGLATMAALSVVAQLVGGREG